MKAAIGLVFVCLPLVASSQSSLGILDIVAKQGVSKADASAVTDFVYDAAHKFGKERFSIIALSQRDSVLEEYGFAPPDLCDEQKCAQEAGEYLTADYVIAGTFRQFGAKYYVSLMIVNVNTTAVEATVRYGASTYDGIEQAINDSVGELFGLATPVTAPEPSDRTPTAAYLTIEPDEEYTPDSPVVVSTGIVNRRVHYNRPIYRAASDIEIPPGKHRIEIGDFEFEHEFKAGNSYVLHPYLTIPTVPISAIEEAGILYSNPWLGFAAAVTAGGVIGVVVDVVFAMVLQDGPPFGFATAAVLSASALLPGLPLWMEFRSARKNIEEALKSKPAIQEQNKSRNMIVITNTTTGDVNVIPITTQ